MRIRSHTRSQPALFFFSLSLSGVASFHSSSSSEFCPTYSLPHGSGEGECGKASRIYAILVEVANVELYSGVVIRGGKAVAPRAFARNVQIDVLSLLVDHSASLGLRSFLRILVIPAESNEEDRYDQRGRKREESGVSKVLVLRKERKEKQSQSKS